MNMSGFGAAAKKSAAVKALQSAVRALGQAVGDKSLVITADGLIGPKTVAAVNRAFKTHVNAVIYNEVSGVSGMTSVQIVANAPALTTAIAGFLKSKGIKATATTTPAKPATAKAPAKTAPTRMSKLASVQRLQQAVRILGQQKGDKALVIAVDGLIGPRTVAAANRALQKYASAAPPEYRTGALTASQLSTMADNLVPYLHQTVDAKIAPKPKSSLTPVPANAPKGKAAVAALQQALQALGQSAGDSTLVAIVADGLVGPKTTGAVNRAFTQYVAAAYAPAQFRTGKLTNASVSANAAKLADLVNREAVRRAGAASPDEGGGEMPTESAETPGQVVAQQQVPAVPGTSAAAQAAQQTQAAQAQAAQAEYMPPGTFTPASSAAQAARASGEEAADDGGALVPAESTAMTPPGMWASMSTPKKVAVGAGAAVGGGLLLWGLVKLFSGRSAARGAVRYARR
jgi:hypothetical protein